MKKKQQKLSLKKARWEKNEKKTGFYPQEKNREFFVSFRFFGNFKTLLRLDLSSIGYLGETDEILSIVVLAGRISVN